MDVLREGPVKITRATIEAAWKRRKSRQRIVIGDAECRGLALVVNPTGMAWRFEYKPRGVDPLTGKRFPTRSLTLGNPETHSPDAARAAANKHKGEAKAGADPAEERRRAVAAAAARRARTVARLVDSYAEALPSRPKLRGVGTISASHAADELAHVRAAVAAMRAEDRPVAEIGDRELRDLLAACAAKPATARHRFGALSRFFDWCQEERHVPVNPCALLAKRWRPGAPQPRQEYLRPVELAQLWKAAGEVEGLAPVHRDLIRFLIAVPCRRGEAASMDWRHVNLPAREWTQPGAMTKNGDPHRLHLPPLAMEVLQRRHEAAGAPAAGLVFPAPLSGKEVDTFSDMKEALSAVVPGAWRWHDFRRSFATALGEAGVSETVADAILNHRQSATRGGVLGVYQRAQRWPEQVKAMEIWNEMLAAATQGREPGAEVVALPPRTKAAAG